MSEDNERPVKVDLTTADDNISTSKYSEIIERIIQGQ
jgi:hypothetical protein